MRISILATTISVATMIIAVSFINGFQDVVASKIFGFWGHIRVLHYEPVRATMAEELPIAASDSLKAEIEKLEKVDNISSYATRSAILNASGTIEGILLKGVDKNYPFEKLDRFLVRGEWPISIDSNTQCIALSEYTAKRLETDTGKSLLAYFIQDDGSAPRTRKMKVTGIFRTGIDVYDRVYAIGDINLIRKMNGWSDQEIGGYEIDLHDQDQMDPAANQIFTLLPAGMNAQTLKELSPEIFDWLGLQNTNKYILISLMSIVAIINLITCLIVLLIERTQMIAMLKSLGARDGMVQRIFILYGSWISAIGIIMGTLLGLTLCVLQQHFKLIRLDEEVYYVDAAPVSIDLIAVVTIAVSTLLISSLMLLIPSLISKKINPARALLFK